MTKTFAALLILALTNVAVSFQATSRISHTKESLFCRLRMSDEEPVNSQQSSLIGIARSFAATNLGVSDPSLLADNFVCSGPSFNGIEKKAYLGGLTKETAVFQRAIPNFDLRPYSFAVDETQSDTVWFKIRPKGTITGPFAYKGEVYLPNKQVVEMPAQQLSVTIRSGQVTRLTAGYPIDRFTGNTNGLAGPQAILYALGEAPSKFSYTPPAVVIRQFLARTKKPVKRQAVKVSPFARSVMTSLAKRVLETSLGLEDDSLLSSDFQFSGPLVGPLSKEEFLKGLGSFNLKEMLPDLRSDFFNYEIDSYDPERVWVISKAKATGYKSAPEAISVSFNEQGLCYRASAGYILDKDQGNTNGLGGVYGILEAIGSPLPWYESRTIAELPELIKKSIFSPAPAKTAPPAKKIAAPVAKPSPPVAAAKPVVAVVEKAAPVIAWPAPVTAKTAAVAKPAAVKPAAVASKPVVKAAAKPVPAPAPVATVTPVAPTVKKVEETKGMFAFLNAPQQKAKPASPAPSAPATAPVAAVTTKTAPVQSKTPVKSAPVTAPAPAPVAAKVPVKAASKVAIIEPAAEVVVAAKPKPSGGMFSMKISKGNMGPKKAEPVPTPEPVAAPIVEKKPSGGMFSMKISKGSTGKLKTDVKTEVKADVKKSI